MPKKKKKKIGINSKESRAVLGIALLVMGIAIGVSPFIKEAALLQYPRDIFGYGAIFWGLAIALLGLRITTSFEYLQQKKTIIGFFIGALLASTLFAFFLPEESVGQEGIHADYGGQVGWEIHRVLADSVGRFIEFILLIAIAVLMFSLVSGTSLEKIMGAIENFFKSIFGIFNRKGKDDVEVQALDGDPEEKGGILSSLRRRPYIGDSGEEEEDQVIVAEANAKGEEDFGDDDVISEEENFEDDETLEISKEENSESNPEANPEVNDNTSGALIIKEPEYGDYKHPPLSILQKPVIQKQDEEIHKRNAVLIERTLQSFDIESKVKKITIGPTVVQYALSITVGTKVAKVKSLTNDLALALATSESLIRIETPIPGTSLIGIEIPNPTPNFVYIRDIVYELKEHSDRYHLPLALGKDVAGKIYIKDLVNMPHLLVAGATGTGKSVGVNSILTGLLMTKTPDELRLILVDPKMVEMAPYNDLPHLITPVITDMELVVNALDWAINEMLTRYRILKQVGAKNIVEYNRKSPEAKMPYVVIIVDEMSDLMQSTGADVDSKILRLAQMARAIGIHLILATQRPDVKVITGVIKANINGRMAFSVSQGIDSRVILDQSGAESLIGRGDMLFKSPDSTKAVRLQGAWTTTEDTEKLVQFIVDQSKGSGHIDDVTNPEPKIDFNGDASGLSHLSEDEYFEQALEQVIATQKGSSSMLQRKFSIGYNRAARLIDELEKYGAVGPQQGSSPRDVLVRTKEEFVKKLQAEDQDDQAVPDEIYDE